MRASFMIAYVTALQLWWASALLISPEAATVSALWDLRIVFGEALPWVLITAALLAMCFMMTPKRPLALALIAPQQVIVTYSTITASRIVLSGLLPSGIGQNRAMLMASLGPVLLACFFHALSVVDTYRRARADGPLYRRVDRLDDARSHRAGRYYGEPEQGRRNASRAAVS